nr:unnamed protein product [Spirometra erinaceieuropaei]
MFDNNDTAISNLLTEKNRLHKAYVTHPTDDSKAAFYRSRRLEQQLLRRCRTLGWLARPKRSKVTCREERPGIRIVYRTDGQPLNHRRMHFQSRVSITTVHELLFADDCALKGTSGGHMRRIMDLFDASRENFGLVINTEKTPRERHPTTIVDDFMYLGSTSSRDTKIDYEVPSRISKASQAFGRLQTQSGIAISPPQHQTEDAQGGNPANTAVWSGDLDGVQEAGAKTQCFPPQLFSTETEIEMAGPDAGHGCNKADGNTQHIRHAETTETALERVDDERLPKRLIYGDIAKGFRQKGGQVCRHKDTLKTSLKRLQINPANWEDLARDRLSWKRTMKTGAAIYEDNRINAAKAKRKARKSALHPPLNANA